MIKTFVEKLTASGIEVHHFEHTDGAHGLQITKNVENIQLGVLVTGSNEKETIDLLLKKLGSISVMIHDVNRAYVASEVAVQGHTKGKV